MLALLLLYTIVRLWIMDNRICIYDCVLPSAVGEINDCVLRVSLCLAAACHVCQVSINHENEKNEK